MVDTGLVIVELRIEHFSTDKGQRTTDEGRDLKDCFFSERSHDFAENKGDPKKRTRNEAIRKLREGQNLDACY